MCIFVSFDRREKNLKGELTGEEISKRHMEVLACAFHAITQKHVSLKKEKNPFE